MVRLKLTGLGTLLNADASGAATTGIGNAEIPSSTIGLFATQTGLRAIRTAVTVPIAGTNPFQRANLLEAIAIGIRTTRMKAGGACAWMLAIVFSCAISKDLSWKPESQRSSC